MDELQEAAKMDPDYAIEIIDLSVDLNNTAGHAIVFMFIECVGRPATIAMEYALVFEWAREHGIWQCYRHTSIRGSSAVPLRCRG